MVKEEKDESVGEFAQLLLGFRTGAGLSQEKLALAAGISIRTLADMERGRTRGPQRRTVRALAAALTLAPDPADALERAAAAGRPRSKQDPEPLPPTALALPRDIGDFTARGEALSRLRTLTAETQQGATHVAVVSGPPGLGKTAFALHAAHSLTDRFPDGQFALDLRGTDAAPAAPNEVLAKLLLAFGVSDNAIPPGLDDRAGLFRSVVRDRRILLLLDNALDEAQVRPLLPASGGSLTVVTSRSMLAGLESVHRIHLDVLKRAEAVELLRRLIGADRVAAESRAALDIVELCGGLPLAVRIAGQRLATLSELPLSTLARQLADEERRLDVLKAGDLQVRAAFELSYRVLALDEQRLFRVLSAVPGPDFTEPVAAALLDRDVPSVIGLLDGLVSAHLVTLDAAGRYRFHDLLRSYAMERFQAEESPQERETALRRLLEWMLHAAEAVGAALPQQRDIIELGTPPSGPPLPVFDTPQQAIEWCEAELANLEAVTRSAVSLGDPVGWQLPHVLGTYFNYYGLIGAFASMYETGLRGARVTGDRAGEAHMLSGLGTAYFRGGRYKDARDAFRSSYEAAAALGRTAGMALELNNMAGTYRAENRFEEAGEHYLRGLELTDPDGDEITYSFLVSNLGIVHEALGRLPEAVDCQRSALAQALRLGRRTLVGSYHRRLAESLLKLGDVEEAGGHLRESLGIAQESGDRMNQILVLIALGRFHLADGEPDAAVACGREAADLSRLRDAPLLAAQALDVAAAGHLAGARLHAARESWQQALVALNDLNQPFAAELLARLAENG